MLSWIRKRKQKSLIAIVVLSVICSIPQAHAIKESQLHQQNYDQDTSKNQVHAKPVEADPNLSFLERYAPPQNITTLNGRIDWLFRYTSWTAFVFFLIIAGSLVYFIVMNRERPGHKAYYTHGTSKANGLVTRLLDISVFISLDLVLIAASFRDTRDIVWAYPDESKEDVVKVMVMPQQWAWNFRYAGNDGKFGTADDIVTINDFRVPKGKKVTLQLQSKDVIHGFMIPNLRIQVDALPGVVTRLWFDTTQTGDFEIACYHHCGTSHYKMKAFFTVMEPEDYAAWYKESSEWAAAMYDPDDTFVHWGWNWSPMDVAPDTGVKQASAEGEAEGPPPDAKAVEPKGGSKAPTDAEKEPDGPHND